MSTQDNLSAIISGIQRFSINDGPGIRTTVFIKGCLLRCMWCHNPETSHSNQELFFSGSKCTLCRRCIPVCDKNCHIIDDNEHSVIREKCVACGKCVSMCFVSALEIVGKKMSVDDVLGVVIRDEAFYKESGGGMTISGGEPLSQPEFTLALAKAGKEKNLHTCLETCGFTEFENIRSLIPYIDIFLYDYKESDPYKHKEYTGVSNEIILSNLYSLDETGAKIILRCPVIPGKNDRMEHFASIADTANRLKNLIRIEIMPYHPLGKAKAERLGREFSMQDNGFPDEKTINRWIESMQSKSNREVSRA